MRQLIVGVDGSEASVETLQRAAEMAEETGWGLTRMVHTASVAVLAVR